MTERDGAMAGCVLLVEDDLALQQLICDYLAKHGFQVEVEAHGARAVERIRDSDYDLVLLDLMLPGKDGISVCREIRPTYAGPVLMLTASGDSVDHVVGLEVGADDFIQKPVEPRVLLARIRALLRRTANAPLGGGGRQSAPEDLHFGELTLHLSRRAVSLAHDELELSKPEYDLLVLLAENAGTVVSRETIFQALRNLPYDGQSRFVDTAISQIRKKLGDHADAYLKTVRGSGYLFVPVR